ncbi:type II secretion system protein GspG [Desulfobotulus sp. H1]|uniref:Type II secretion system protein GspG n=1 Tax=Desulfobotulus pelophilus TaxID=2823377 RepID=A0ABT3N6Q8_9BACT|nr:type II secretion system protein GspG [Desulfobotulus pelophilus]MCW7753142.1 type II secretion system protein GspG [Desulfobotulus pelophilus]
MALSHNRCYTIEMRKIVPPFRKSHLRFLFYLAGILLLFQVWTAPADILVHGITNTLREILTRNHIQEIAFALEKHYLQTGLYPPPEELGSWLTREFPHNMQKQMPIDRWGNGLSYIRTPDGRGFQLICHGADGILNTGDDFGISIFYPGPRPIETTITP